VDSFCNSFQLVCQRVFEAISSTSAIGIMVYLCENGEIVFSNEYVARALGYTASDKLKGKCIWDFVSSGEDCLREVRRTNFSRSCGTVFFRTQEAAVVSVEVFVYETIYCGKRANVAVVIDKTEELAFKKLFFALSRISQLASRVKSEDALLSGICDTLVDAVGYEAVTIGYVDEATKIYRVKYTRSKNKEVEDVIKRVLIGVDPGEPYGRGTVSRAYREKKIALLVDILAHDGMKYWQKEQLRFGIHSACSIPILVDGKVRYILLIHDKSKDSFAEKHLYLLKEIQTEASSALSKIRMRNRLLRQQRFVQIQSRIYNTLYHVSKLSMEAREEGEFFRCLPELFTRYLGVDVAFFAVVVDKSVFVVHYSVRNSSDESLVAMLRKTFDKVSFGEGRDDTIVLKAYKKKRIYLVNDLSVREINTLRHVYGDYGMGAGCAIPIVKKGESVGVLVLLSRHKNFFSACIYRLLNVISAEIEFILNKFENEKFSRTILAAFDVGSECVTVMDENFNIVYVNENVVKMSGYERSEIIGKNYYDACLRNIHNDALEKVVCKTLEKGETFSGSILYRTKNGQVRELHSVITPVVMDNKVRFYVAVGSDVERENALKREIEKLQHFDRLTGLYTRSSFEERINLFTSLGSSIGGKVGAVAIVDPASFSEINQVFGFEEGDKMLEEVAERIVRCLRDYDVAGRLESDKFGILMVDVERNEATSIASRLLSELSKPYVVNGSLVTLSFSIGMSFYPADGINAGVLLNRAGIALLDAKRRGANNIGFFDESLQKEKIKRFNIKSMLERAVEKGDFILYYQPYVDSELNIVGAESLLRWRRNNRIVPPMEFVPYLETTDLIAKVEYCNLDRILERLKRLSSVEPIPISVNLSCGTIRREDLVQQIATKIRENSVGRNLVGIEIVERSFMEDLGKVKQLIRELRDIGVFVSIDDFGTGYSSLSYLAQLPVDFLKIDISFIRAIAEDKHTCSIVRSIIFLSKEINIKTIAEGVETKEQFEILKEMGCDYFQGYLFFKPMSGEELERLLRLR